MNAAVNKGIPEGKICIPASKSILHRLIILAALAKHKSVIRNITLSEDIAATLDCIKTLGADYSVFDDRIEICGIIKNQTDTPVFNCRESGSTLRFFIPLALCFFNTAEFCGSQRLIERGAGVYKSVFAEKGVSIKNDGGKITVSGKFCSGEYSVPGNVSSQFISGLMLSLPFLPGESVLTVLPPAESMPYIDITVNTLEAFGVKIIKKSQYSYFIPGNQTPCAVNITAEGDWSNAAFFFALNALGGNIQIDGLNKNSSQGDKICTKHINALLTPGAELDLSDCPDLGPVLFSVAAALHGAVFTGTRRLKIKESDRVLCMCGELQKFGVKTLAEENRLTIYPGGITKPACPLNGHNDHRIVMALSVLLCLTGGEITGAQAVNKSYPGFFDALQGLGIKCTFSD